jgi:hypothetical protein
MTQQPAHRNRLAVIVIVLDLVAVLLLATLLFIAWRWIVSGTGANPFF